MLTLSMMVSMLLSGEEVTAKPDKQAGGTAVAELRRQGAEFHRLPLYRLFLHHEEDGDEPPTDMPQASVALGRTWTGGRAGAARLRALPGLKEVILGPPGFKDEWCEELEHLPRLESVFLGRGFTDRGVRSVGKLSELQVLGLTDTAVTDEGLRHLEDKVKLRWLSLAGTGVTDKGLVYLKRLKRLEALYLEETPTSGKGLAHLSGLTQLRRLRLSRRLASPATAGHSGLEHLAGMREMRLLDARGLFVTDDELVVVRNMPHLQELRVDFSRITDRGLSHLRALAELKVVNLSGSRITGEGLRNLADLKRLRHLDLSFSPVDDTAVPEMKRLTRLKSVGLLGTRLSRKAVRQLRRDMPHTDFGEDEGE